MPLTRLDNLLSSKTGKYLYVSPDDFNATDALDNRGNSPLRPFVSIQRAFLESARFSYLPDVDNDRFDQFTIMLAPGNHYIDNRPGVASVEQLPVFQYNQSTNEWESNTNVSFNLGNPDNILYKFNGRDGGATIPRGTSLVGTDLRRTQVRPLYVPDPADKDVPRTSLFNVTGGCYFWQFTILDGDLTSSSPLYDVGSPVGIGKVYTQPGSTTNLSIPEFSHHKMTNFVFADKEDLGLLYRKIARVFSDYQPSIDDVYVEGSITPVTDAWLSATTYQIGDRVIYEGKSYIASAVSTNVIPSSDASKWSLLVIRGREFDYRVQENRIVGPLSDAIRLDEVTVTDSSPAGILSIKVRTKINHGFFPSQYVAVTNNGLNISLNGVFKVYSISQTDPKEFTYRVQTTATGLGLLNGATYTAVSSPALDTNATVQAEVDSVESASPYIFNVSIRSTWGICGIWADGRKATGFKSMVIAQYTGVSLQKDDRAFIRYDEFSNTWNQAPLTDAFATTPYHIKGDAYWKDDWRNFHVRASDDSFIQNVSIFAVGFADHFLLESGGDMSITNSNSNFGNTSMHSKGYKGFAFNQDKGGYITDIIPPKSLSTLDKSKQQYYVLDFPYTRVAGNTNKLYLGSETTKNPEDRPASTVNGYRVGARRNEKIYVKLDNTNVKQAELFPSGFKKWTAVVSTLNPTGGAVFDATYNKAQDAANLIDSNKTFIQSEAFGYILEKYPYLQDRPYINPNITSETGRYRDGRNLILANRTEIIDYAFAQMQTAFPTFTVPGGNNDKCKRDIGYIVDAIAADLYDGGNSHMIEATKAYFTSTGSPLSNGLVGEETQSIFAFNRTRDWCKKAISNLLTNKSLLSLTSITSSGTTVTVICSTAHNLTAGTYVTVGGAQQTAYNGKFAVLSAGLTSTQFRYTALSAPAASPATGATYVSTVTIDPVNDDPNVGRFKDSYNLINSNRTEIIDTAFSQMQAAFPTFTVPGGNNTKCKRDIGYIVDSVAQDLFWGGNEFIVGATKEYFSLAGSPISNGLVGEETQSVFAFNAARDLVKQAITNQLTVKNLSISVGPAVAGGGGGNIANTSSSSCADVRSTVDTLFAIITGVVTAGNLNSIPSVDNGDFDCANVRSTIDTLTSIITTSLSAGNLNSLPTTNVGPWSQVSEASKCKRDIGYIIEAVTSDLRLGGNENVINAAEAYYTAIPLVNDTLDGNPDGFTLDYIENERPETIDAYNYVRNLAISSMRNHNTYINNATTVSGSSTVTVSSTVGLSIGMRVRSVDAIPTSSSSVVNFTATIPSTSYIKKIGDGTNGLTSNQIQLGTQGSRFNSGTTVNATASSTTVKLYVELNSGLWSTSLDPVTDSAVIQDYNYLAAGDISNGAPGGECASTALAITNYFQTISTIINSGVGTVPRVASTLNTGILAQRSTLFTLTEYDSNSAPTTNPHDLETGAPVRLVPRAKSGTNPDKRVIRLPKGFDTNTLYYVIAPGRRTDPFNYASSIGFNGSNQQNLMLATSEENAAAGIYIYSSETDAVDLNVEIDVYQYVLDIKYDLHQYQTGIASGSSTEFETDRPHIFDKPAANTTLQRVFFRVGSDISGSALPTLSSSFGGGTISTKVEYYVNYVSSTRFTIHESATVDSNGNLVLSSPVTFQTGSTAKFYTFASKKRSPMKFDPVVGTTASNNNGCWYINTLISGNDIIPKMKESIFEGRIAPTTDTYYERVVDSRAKEDRVYRLRYVIPKNLKTVRDPLNGFVLKIRTDEKRRLVPQKILLKPTSTGANVANFVAPLTGEKLGLTTTEQLVLNPNYVTTYDPSPAGNPKRVETTSKISFTIQSARKKEVKGTNYLELTVFDIGVDNNSYKTKLFTTVKVSAPQGGSGSFVSSIPNSNSSNIISWSGNSSGTAYVHAYFAYQNEYYMILKDFTGNSTIDYINNVDTIFTQGTGSTTVSATLAEDANGGRSDIDNFLYVIEGANVYTMTPGDTVNDDNGVSYTVSSVEDINDFDNTYYIFDINTVRRRIFGQQDGVYYLTCLRGDIRPYPTGSGVGENFRNFRFSQPVSKLYPEFYKNDPEWYKGIDTASATLLDPPATVSAADNYVHGLVTVNDSKGSVTREVVYDFVNDAGTKNNTFTGSNIIQAQSGSASAGSEARKIPVCGDSSYPLERKLYVELRRPSIARSGNHTFEYLGFGPGNYSTGFPARQEVVLTDTQDFYAQAKREDAGIVFYTGLNSNGDLYIGNRKINAITGEETFLEQALLVESADETEDIGTLVTTFDTPVTFNDIITVSGLEGTKTSTFFCPVAIQSPTMLGAVLNSNALTIYTDTSGRPFADGNYDQRLETNIAGQQTGDITLHQNTISSAVWNMHPRGTQRYTFRGAISNVTPNTTSLYGSDQPANAYFNTLTPLASGDVLFKGAQTLFTGSLGWVYANDYITIGNISQVGVTPQIIGIQGNATGTVIKLNWNTGVTNNTLGITSSTQIRITGATGSIQGVNGVWPVYSVAGDPFAGGNVYVNILTNANLPSYTAIPAPNNGYPVDQVAQPSINIARSQTGFKEVGVIGAEALRTESSSIGEYKLGINTVARSAHSAYQTAFVSDETTPRANLDVVGTAFISGKKILSYATESSTTKTQTNQDYALLVGGDSAIPANISTLRVATTPNGFTNGRVGINATHAQLDRNFVVVGTSRFTGTLTFEDDLAVNGGDITTTATTFNLLNTSGTSTTLNFAGYATTANLFNSATSTQSVNIGNSAASQTLAIGTAATTGVLNLHTSSTNSTVTIGSASSSLTAVSNITVGGAYNNSAGSRLTVRNRNVQLDGDLEVNGGSIKTSATTFNLFNNPGTANTLNFANYAAVINMGAVAGNTTIRNSLIVNGSITDYGDLTLIGGLRNAAVVVNRATLNSSAATHTVGSLSNLNVTYYEYIDDIDGATNINSISSNTFSVIDNKFYNNDVVRFVTISNFTGVSIGVDYYVVNRTSTTFQVSSTLGGSALPISTSGTIGGTVTLKYTQVDTIGGVPWSSSDTTLPVKNPAGISQLDYLLIDQEIVRVSTPPTATAPFTMTVTRGVDGTVAASHLDDAIIYKLNKVTAATYVDPGPLPASSLSKTVSSINATTNFLTSAGTNLQNGYKITFTNVGSITGIDTTALRYYICNVSVVGSDQIFQLSETFPIINVVDIGGTSGAAAYTVTGTVINLAEFGGSFKANDILKIDNEFMTITSISTSTPQKLTITDGGTVSPKTVFEVDSTTGNTIIGNPTGTTGNGTGTLLVYDNITLSGNSATDGTAQRLIVTNGSTSETFTVRTADGNTNIAGTLTVENTITLNGSTTASSQFFRITDGAGTPVTTFQVDSANGNTSFLGNLAINTNKFTVDASTGDTVVGRYLTVTGVSSASPSSANISLLVNNLGVSNAKPLRIKQDASIDAFGITNYRTSNGGTRWNWIATGSNTDATAPTLGVNQGYILRPSGTNTVLVLKLPSTAITGDMIRFVDIGGNLSYQCTLLLRAPTGIKIQGDATGSTSGGLGSAWTGGELIIQTPNAASGLIYFGATDGGGVAIDTDAQGWWLVEI
jgi:hypothetical protein